MEYMDIIRAKEGMATLQTAKFPLFQLKTMRTIYQMNNEIEEIVRFIGNEERKILTKYGGEINSNGQVVFPPCDNPEDKAQKVTLELEELHKSEVEWKFEKIQIPLSVLSECDVSLSPADLEAIEVLITITEEESEV